MTSAFALWRPKAFSKASEISPTVAFARAVGRPDEKLTLTTLGEADPSICDMSTLVLIGSSETRFITRPDGLAPWIYTPRHYGGGR
jgi:precorrin-3B C17-methyltransferase